MSNNNSNNKSVGLKRLTKPHSVPMKTAPGGKDLVRDNGKQRLHKVAGEK